MQFLLPNASNCIDQIGGGCCEVCPFGCYQAWVACKHVGDDQVTGHDEWKTGVFDCLSDLHVCLCFVLCPLAVSSRTRAHYPELANETCEGICLTTMFMWIATPCYLSYARSRMRTMWGVRGSRQQDCLLTFFCTPCTQCQEAREVRAREYSIDPQPVHPPPKPEMA